MKDPNLPKLYPLTDGQVETLKSLLATTVNEVEGDQHPDQEYIDELRGIYDSLLTPSNYIHLPKRSES